MKGNFHVRFLGGRGREIARAYPAARCRHNDGPGHDLICALRPTRLRRPAFPGYSLFSTYVKSVPSLNRNSKAEPTVQLKFFARPLDIATLPSPGVATGIRCTPPEKPKTNGEVSGRL